MVHCHGFLLVLLCAKLVHFDKKLHIALFDEYDTKQLTSSTANGCDVH